MRRVIKEVRIVQSFLSPRGAAALLMALPMALLAAAPAHAVTSDSAMHDARDIAITTGQAIGVFAIRIAAGDMMAIRGVVFGFSGLVALIGLWMLLLRSPREESVIIAMNEEGQEPLILNSPVYRPAQPAPSPATRADGRPERLLEAIAAAKAQYDIAVAERDGPKPA